MTTTDRSSPPAPATISVGEIATPVGTLRVAERHGHVVVLAFADHFDRVGDPVRRRFPHDRWTEARPPSVAAVERYVAGDLAALDDLRVDLAGTAFRQRVWRALRGIPAGETWSYRDVAQRVDAPTAVRAVGSANGANPAWLVVPCHRVVRADGGLGGYGGGVDRKAWLLAHEGAVPRIGGAGVALP